MAHHNDCRSVYECPICGRLYAKYHQATVCEFQCKADKVEAPSWTREPPTEPGWYWVIVNPDDPEYECVYMQEDGCVGVIGLREAIEPTSKHRTLWWTAPIVPPKEKP